MKRKLIMLCFVCLFVCGCTKKEKKQEILDPPILKESSLSLLIGGDVMIHTATSKDKMENPRPSFNPADSNYFKSDDRFDFRSLFAPIKPFVSSHDLAFANQESILGGVEIGLSDFFVSNAPYEVGNALIDTGFNLISLANNHTFDRGETAILNSLHYWNQQKVYTAGSYISSYARDEIKIKEKNGISYALLAYTTFTNIKNTTNDYYVTLYEKETVKKEIEKYRDQVDLLIVSMHWGNEYTHKENEEQREIASYLASLGVDLVIGNHAHMVQPIEKINNTLIFYAMGNLISIQTYAERRIGLLASLNVKKENGKISITIPKYEFIYTAYEGKEHNIRVLPFSQLTNEILPQYQQYLKEVEDVVHTYPIPIKAIP